MKKDMVKYLFELYERFEPGFQEIFAIEYPKLSGEQQLAFLSLLNKDMDKVLEMLHKLEEQQALAAA